MSRFARLLIVSISTLMAGNVLAQKTLTILSHGPRGELSSIEQANEIRVVFSEPMVSLGRIPTNYVPTFFKITPAVTGTFRWSGTNTLVFTPDVKKKLPFATKYSVTIDSGLTAVSGAKLDQPLAFTFTTPTLRLLNTNFYRKGDAPDGPIVFGLRFNQPIDRAALAPHLRFETVAYEPNLPTLGPKARAFLAKMHPNAVAELEAKIAAIKAAASSSTKVMGFIATDWDRKVLGEGKDLLVFETRPGVAPSSRVRVQVDESATGKQGTEGAGFVQEFTAELDQAFFVASIGCQTGCNPDSYNAIHFTREVDLDAVRKAITVTDITDASKPVMMKQAKAKPEGEGDEEGEYFDSSSFTLDDAGYSIEPAHTYLVTLDKSLTADDGQPLGYTWGGYIEYWHKVAFSSFGDGHGVWESSGGTQIPFYARNLREVDQWLEPLTIDELFGTVASNQEHGFRSAPDGAPFKRKLNPTPDKIQSFGVDASKVLAANGKGLFWAAIKDGATIPKSHPAGEDDSPRSTIIQVTNLGISVKDSPLNTLIFVTTLDDGKPVQGARVAIRNAEKKIFWQGTTDAKGIAIATRTPLRESTWKFAFIVTAEKDGDVAYVGSNWNEGISPWEFSTNFDLSEKNPLLRGTVFTDRGVYKLGEEIHLKAILRSDTPNGIKLLPRGTKAVVTVKDSHDQVVHEKTITMNDWSAADWSFKLPSDGALGDYSIHATVESQALEIYQSFLVAAYRRPDFRVDVKLTGPSTIAGTKLKGNITGKYLFGGAMARRPLMWSYTKTRSWSVPDAIRDRFPDDRFEFIGGEWEDGPSGRQELESKEAKLDDKGVISLDLATDKAAGYPFVYSLEGEVTDVSRQKIAGRTSYLVHPAPWYVGMKRPPYFADATKGISTELVAVSLDGKIATGVPIKVELKQIQWHSVRRAEGNGFYTWDTERKETPAGSWDVVSANEPVALQIPIDKGGYYVVRAIARDNEGRSVQTSTSFYASGGGYTAWERFDHNRIELVPEKKSYKPGDSARILIKSPWERATALLTTEREGVRSQRQFELTSTQQTVTVPITDADIPNLFVSVLLIKGRTKEAVTEDSSDPGKPAFRLGYVGLDVEDDGKRLQVSVRASREEFRPGAKAKVQVAVKDVMSKPTRAEVTLWAVDYGVLSLTAFRPPDLLRAVYIEKALQVMNQDSRQRIISRRVITPKGETDGGGGGMEFGNVRKDFRVLAFWLGSVITNDRGEASVDVTLPESLTTYRIMAVASDKQSRFGSGDQEIRTNKPLLLKPAFPRFLTIGDVASFGSVVHNQAASGGDATVTLRSLDPELLEITGEPSTIVKVGAGAAQEVRFNLRAKAPGTARLQMLVKMGDESDAFEDVIPIKFVASPEVVAAYGVAAPDARETLTLPTGVVPTFGGLHVGLASTALVGLSEGAKYLVEYPYGCAEQRASTTLALMLAADVGGEFKVPGLDSSDLKPAVAASIAKLATFQCGSGGFAFWPGQCESVSPYLTSWILYVLQRAKSLKYNVSDETLANGYVYLEGELAADKPLNEAWWPWYSSWQAFSVKVLAEGGRNADSHINRLYERLDRMPVFALAYLHDALMASEKKDAARIEELRRRMMNAILTEAGASHVEELNDEYLLMVWSSNTRSTAIVLDSLVRAKAEPVLIRSLVRGLMDRRTNGRWGNTQENAWALAALVGYYRAYEKETPDFLGTASLGNETIAKAEFRGRSTAEKVSDTPMQQLLKKAPAASSIPLIFNRQGTGQLFYTARLVYASSDAVLEGKNQGFAIERVYTPVQAKPGSASVNSYKAGDTLRVTLRLTLTKDRTFVAVTDPLPAGFEAIETRFATTSSDDAAEANEQENESDDWREWWLRGGFDHVERHDDRVNVFATRLGVGTHSYSYTVRATTSGTFRSAPARAEEMYRPEIWGRTATAQVEVKE